MYVQQLNDTHNFTYIQAQFQRSKPNVFKCIDMLYIFYDDDK